MESKLILPGMGGVGGAPASRIRTKVAKYLPAAWKGANTSGIVPLGKRALVLVDKPEEQTMGGITLPIDVVERHGLAAVTGMLVASGPTAFTGPKWGALKPQPGERVLLEQYAGQVQLGADGEVYRIMEDDNIGAVLPDTPDTPESATPAEVQ